MNTTVASPAEIPVGEEMDNVTKISPSSDGTAMYTEEKKEESEEEDSDDGDDNESSSEEEESDNDDDDGEAEESEPSNGISEYEQLRLDRIKRNQDRLRELGLVDDDNKGPGQRNKKPQKRQRRRDCSTSSLVATREQPKRNKSKKGVTPATGAAAVVPAAVKEEKPQQHNKKKRKSVWYLCGDCDGCRLTAANVEPCGTCVNCVERIRSGRRRRCLFKQCRRRHEQNNNNSKGNDEERAKDQPQQQQSTESTESGTQQQQQQQQQEQQEQQEQQTESDIQQPKPVPDREEATTIATILSTTESRCAICLEESPDHFCIGCTKCGEKYHSNCHVPKIKEIPSPDENWVCMDCHPKSAKQLALQGEEFPKARLWAVVVEGKSVSWEKAEKAKPTRKSKRSRKPTYKTIKSPPDTKAKQKKEKRNEGGDADRSDKSDSDASNERGDDDSDENIESQSQPSISLVKLRVLEPSPYCTVCNELCLLSTTSASSNTAPPLASLQCKACDEYYHWDCHVQHWHNVHNNNDDDKESKDDNKDDDGDNNNNNNNKEKDDVDDDNNNNQQDKDKDSEEKEGEHKEGEDQKPPPSPPLPPPPPPPPPPQMMPNRQALAFWKCTTCVVANREILPHHQPKERPKTEKKKKAKKRKREQNTLQDILNKLNLFKGEHEDDCYICEDGGDCLVCCDFCEKVYHCGCHVPPLPTLPTGIWKCCECYAEEQQLLGKEMTRCGDCPACKTKPCGECKFCTSSSSPTTEGEGEEEGECEKKPDCKLKSWAPTYVPGKIPGLVLSQQEMDELERQEKKRKRRKSDTRDMSDSVRYFDPNEASGDEGADDDNELGLIVKLKVPKLMDAESVNARKHINSAIRAEIDPKIVGTGRAQVNTNVLNNALLQLRKMLARSPTSLDKIILAGGIDMISNVLSSVSDKAAQSAEVFSTIAALAWVEPKVAIKLAHAGVVQKIIHCMEAFPTNGKVQITGCGAFRALSYEGSNIVVINNAYGINATLCAIKRNPRKRAVHLEACVFLQNMFVQLPAENVAERILASEVMETLLGSLGAPEADAELRVTILKVIANLTITPKAKKAIGGSESVISCVVAELGRTKNPVDVRQSALEVLENISLISSTTKRKVIKADVVGALAKAATAFPQNSTLLECTFRLIWILIQDNRREDVETANDFTTNHNGKGILLAAMRDHLETPTVQIAACKVIAYLPFGNSNKDENIDSKDDDALLGEAILRAMKAHPISVAVQGPCLEALLELGTHVSAVRNQLKQQETVELLLHTKSLDDRTTIDLDDILELTKD